jgi:hypothetical protein
MFADQLRTAGTIGFVEVCHERVYGNHVTIIVSVSLTDPAGCP